jgi:ParB-like chromosome segregation protein Spo0J
MIPITKLTRHPQYPRLSDTPSRMLLESIKTIGLVNSILVVHVFVPQENKLCWVVLSGWLRVRAFEILGEDMIPYTLYQGSDRNGLLEPGYWMGLP